MKPRDLFYACKSRKDGLQPYCKTCQRARIDRNNSKKTDAEFEAFVKKHGLNV